MTENKNISLIDTNVLVYGYDSNEKEKQSIAINLLGDCWKLKRRFVLSVQNLSEFFTITTKKISHPIPLNEVQSIIRDITSFSHFSILSITKKTILSAITLCAEYSVSYWDALIAATMLENNIFTIYTENEKDFKKIPRLEVINPFS